MPSPSPLRGELWLANLGDPKRHAVVIVSLDSRNRSDRANSVLIVPVGSYGVGGPTTLRLMPGETGLPGPSWIKAHFIQVLPKDKLLEKLPRRLSQTQMKEVVAMINRAIDPNAPWGGGQA